MPASVPLRRDFDARHLRKLASRCKDARQSRRCCSCGGLRWHEPWRGRKVVAKPCGTGADGLTNRKGFGEIVETGFTLWQDPTTGPEFASTDARRRPLSVRLKGGGAHAALGGTRTFIRHATRCI